MPVDSSPLPSAPVLIPGFAPTQELDLCPYPAQSPPQAYSSWVTSAIPIVTMAVNVPNGAGPA
jgi:hypothetical protein